MAKHVLVKHRFSNNVGQAKGFTLLYHNMFHSPSNVSYQPDFIVDMTSANQIACYKKGLLTRFPLFPFSSRKRSSLLLGARVLFTNTSTSTFQRWGVLSELTLKVTEWTLLKKVVSRVKSCPKEQNL
jgi:hypothetical protein